MASIIIADLEEDQELDAQAMRAIFGGRSLSLAQGDGRSMKFAARTRFVESALIPGLIKIDDLRSSELRAS